jgi:hypothetical protein
MAHWERRASAESVEVDAWWSNGPWSILLATGRTFDVVEVPMRIGRTTAREARIGPVAVSPTGRWMFLVEPGEALRPSCPNTSMSSCTEALPGFLRRPRELPAAGSAGKSTQP